MPHYQVTLYRKDADSGKRHHLGSEQVEAESPQQARQIARDRHWDERLALTGAHLEIEVAALDERLYEASLLLAGPDGSRSLLGEEAVWAVDEAAALVQLREKGLALAGQASAYLVVEITAARD